jgi:hypothetical protein
VETRAKAHTTLAGVHLRTQQFKTH